jgi:hypothetical protein
MNKTDPHTGKLRDQLGYTLDVIQWPHIQPRDENEVEKIIQHGNLNNLSHVTKHRISDGIYNLYTLDKSDIELSK